MACLPSGLMTLRSYRPSGALRKSKVARIQVESITSHFTGSNSATSGRTTLRMALSANLAPRTSKVTQRLSPPWSTCTLVIANGTTSASRRTGVLARGSLCPRINT